MILPSKYLLVFKIFIEEASSRYVLKKPSTLFQRNNFLSSITSSRRLGRRKIVTLNVFKTSCRHVLNVLKTCLEDILKTCLEDVLKTCLEDVLKTYLEDVFKTSRRQTKCLLVISVPNKSKCVSNKSIFYKSISDESKANPKCIN